MSLVSERARERESERGRAVARDTVQGVRSVCLLSVLLCQSFLNGRGVARGLTALAFASTPGKNLAQSAHRAGGRGGSGRVLRQTLRNSVCVVSRVSLCLCKHCEFVTLTRDDVRLRGTPCRVCAVSA